VEGSAVSSFLHRHSRLRLGAQLSLPLAWLVVIYFGALAALLATSFYSLNTFTSAVERTFTLANYQSVFSDAGYVQAALRTVAIALGATAICMVLGVPVAFFMAKIASLRWRGILLALMITPLWASYLVKVYAWQAMLQPETGVVAWLGKPVGLSGPGFGAVATTITLAYLWLPYMVLPVFSGLERMPDSLLEAAGDLGARTGRTLREVVLPIVWPSIVAGSIFTFSLSLGDYIAVQVVGAKTQMLGNIVYQNYTTNLPFAAAIATIPVVIMLGYLALARRAGALENL
jgi:putative spermidine/putrescine transport system permease protein